MRFALFFLILLIFGIAIFCFSPRRIVTYQDEIVSAGEIKRPIDSFIVHLSTSKFLTINGESYVGVRGLVPYFLKIPDLNGIIFVTQKKNQNVIIHIIELETKEHIQIDAEDSGFGWNIGSIRTPGDKYTDFIESVDSKRVTVATRSGDWKETLVLNLTSGTIEHRETLYFDATGQEIDHSVQTNELTGQP